MQFESVVSANNPDGVTSAVQVANARVNDRWFDGHTMAHNVFGSSSNGSAGEGGEQ